MDRATSQNLSLLNPRALLIIIALAVAGGYADAATYLLAGSFTGHLTGNTILAAIAFGYGNWHALARPVLAIALFLTGTSAGLLLGRYEKRIQPLLLALPFEALLVAVASLSPRLGVDDPKLLVVACLCLALGVQNGVFYKAAGVPVHATYVTGDVTSLITLIVQSTRTAHDFTSTGIGNKEQQSLSTPTTTVLVWTWVSFSGGALLSGLMVKRFGITAMWFLELPMLVAAVSAGRG